jgi:kynurenine formamidase
MVDSDLTREDVVGLLRGRRNWGRWGTEDGRGAVNLITEQKVCEATRLVTSGRTVSLSQVHPVRPGPGNSRPAQQFIYRHDLPHGGGVAYEYIGVDFHHAAVTHIDALCHIWDEDGMWGGRRPSSVFGNDGAAFGDIDQFGHGIITRGVLLDIPRHRGEAYVSSGSPVRHSELEDVVRAQDVEVRPGDALILYSGRENWTAAHPEYHAEQAVKPGIHVSCLSFVRDHDIAVVLWDMMDEHPDVDPYALPWGMHGSLISFGTPLVDNCYLSALAEACAEQSRYEFLLMLAPLRIVGGTGSPINPIAVL